MSIFMQASRIKLRFEGRQGQLLTVEDLWELPLTHPRGSNLDDIAIALDSKIPKKSFVEDIAASDAIDTLKLDIVKAIIAIRKQERVDAQLAESKRAEKQKLLEILSRKKEGELENLTAEELEARIAAL